MDLGKLLAVWTDAVIRWQEYVCAWCLDVQSDLHCESFRL